MSSGSRDDRADPHPRVQRRVRVLEHELQVAALRGAGPRRRSRPRPRPPKQHAAAVGCSRPTIIRPERRLAAARLADQAERLARADGERDAGDRADSARPARTMTPADRELLDEVARPRAARRRRPGPWWRHRRDPAARAAGRPRGAARPWSAAACSGRQPPRPTPGGGAKQAYGGAGVPPRSAGAPRCGSASVGVSAARREPAARRRVGEVGRQAGDRVQPLHRCPVERSGIDAQQRLGVAVPGVGEQLGRRRPSRRSGRRTSPRRGRRGRRSRRGRG